MPDKTLLPTPEPAPAQRSTTITMQVAEQIRNNLLHGHYPPGSQLGEVELAESLGVSRGPIREGLARLVQEGLLLSRPRRGVFVPQLSEEDILDIFYTRETLETAALRRVMATTPRPHGLVRSLHDTTDKLTRAAEHGDWPTVSDLDLHFHSLIINAAASPRLSRLYTTVISETRLCLNLQANTEPTRQNLPQEHRELAHQVAHGDITTVLATLTQHFEEATLTLRTRLHATKP